MREAGGAVHAGGLCLSQANKDTGCRMEIKNHSMEKLLHPGTDERDPFTSHQSPMAVSSAQVDISFLKRLCDSCGECPGNAKYTNGIFFGN